MGFAFNPFTGNFDNTGVAVTLDGKLLVSGSDTTSSFLKDKIVAGSGITVIESPAGSQYITVNNIDGGSIAIIAHGSAYDHTLLHPALTLGSQTNGLSIAASQVITMAQSTGSTTGALTGSDWTIFNGKQNALTFGNFGEVTSSVFTVNGGTNSVIGSGVTIEMAKSTGSTSGYLSGSDFTVFNAKQNALTLGSISTTNLTLGGVGQIVGSGLTINTPQDVSTTASPTFALATIGSVVIPTIMTDTKEATGFVNRTNAIAFDDGTLTFTITGNHDIYINGVKTTKPTGSTTIANTVGLHFIYYSLTGSMTSNVIFPGTYYPLIASVYWNGTNGLLADERHGITMDWATHQYLHFTVGARYSSGFTGTFTNSTLSITGGTFYDEDLECTASATMTTTSLIYKNGSANPTFETSVSTPYKAVAGVLRYNNANTLTAVPDNNYVASWVFATNDVANTIAIIVGQRVDTNINNARSNNTYETLTFGTIPYAEMKLLYRVIYRNVGGVANYVETADYRSSSALAGGNFIATAHSSLTGLTSDDHLQYMYLAGRDGGQTLVGGNTPGANLTFQSTSDVTKGGYVFSELAASAVGVIGVGIGGGLTRSVTTANLAENTNLYYTDARVRAAITATAPITFASATGVISYAVGSATKTADATLSTAEFATVVKLSAASASVAITLPTVGSVAGMICRMKVVDASNACTIVGTIDGVSGYTFTGLYDSVTIYSDGGQFWFI